MKKIINTECIIIKKIDINESDRIVKLFSKDLGILEIFIKGIRKSKNRDINATEIGVISNYYIYKNNNKYNIKSFEINKYLNKIYSNLDKINLLYYILFILNSINVEENLIEKIYVMTKKALIYLNKEENINNIYIMLTVYLFNIIKYEGILFSVEKGNKFDIINGKITKHNNYNIIKLSEEQVIYLEKLFNIDIEGINKLKFDDKQIIDIIVILERYINYHLHIKIDFKQLMRRNILNGIS
ncbi:DNA replication and repair protein RecO [Hypnocyclicus thermotrophus]|uniref:DNA repair protein RecO n=1 Tax=Hypnocyclicus thermotrophus TaxID=1627895 RepID=A0AA46DXZ2_9FUSO|nr:DNA repair protein RecO [Hypnocyclicus thermotrophus]TDT69148.1 DNA replication and repair protein RecO [Hypnocyclicus thermotrophus]